MIDNFLSGLTLLTALGCGLIAGAFFGFSAFVMKGLARLPAAQGIAAMQSINVAAISPLFMTVLLGTAAGCVILAVSALTFWHRSGSEWLETGTLLYLGGVILVTRVFNIPPMMPCRGSILPALKERALDPLHRNLDNLESREDTRGADGCRVSHNRFARRTRTHCVNA